MLIFSATQPWLLRQLPFTGVVCCCAATSSAAGHGGLPHRQQLHKGGDQVRREEVLHACAAGVWCPSVEKEVFKFTAGQPNPPPGIAAVQGVPTQSWSHRSPLLPTCMTTRSQTDTQSLTGQVRPVWMLGFSSLMTCMQWEHQGGWVWLPGMAWHGMAWHDMT